MWRASQEFSLTYSLTIRPLSLGSLRNLTGQEAANPRRDGVSHDGPSELQLRLTFLSESWEPAGILLILLLLVTILAGCLRTQHHPALFNPQRAHGVVASHPLRMRKALGSNPSVSICRHIQGITSLGHEHDSHPWNARARGPPHWLSESNTKGRRTASSLWSNLMGRPGACSVACWCL